MLPICLLDFDNPHFRQPLGKEGWPVGGGAVALAHADAVGAPGEDVEGKRPLVSGHGGGQLEAVLDRDGCIFRSVHQENGRRSGMDIVFEGQVIQQSGIGIVSEQVSAGTGMGMGIAEGGDRVGQHAEVRSGGNGFLRIFGKGIGGVMPGDGHTGDMGSGGEAKDANAGRVEVALRGRFAEETEGLGDIPEGRGVAEFVQAVFEDKSIDSEGVEPVGDFLTLLDER